MRLVLLLAVAILYALLSTLLLLLKPISPIHRLVHGFVTFILARLALFALGFIWIQANDLSLKKGRMGSIDSVPAPAAGDIIVSNWSSYVDVLYFVFRYDPVLTQSFSTTNTLRVVSLWQALMISGAEPVLSPPSGVKTYTMDQLVQKYGSAGPILVFPEGTTSNNRCILRFNSLFQHAIESSKGTTQVHVVTLKYEYSVFAPTTSTPPTFVHLAQLAGQYLNNLIVYRYTIPYRVEFTTEVDNDDKFGATIADQMGKLSRLRKAAGLGVAEKRTFLAYYATRKH